MTYSFHPEAEAELVAGVTYYEDCEIGLGLDFSREVYTAVTNIVEYPRMWHEIAPGVRRCLVHRFPYGILYSIEPHCIFVLAVMHLHREPDYWRDRSKPA